MADDVQRLAVLIEAQTKSYENAMLRMEQKTSRAMARMAASTKSLNARMGVLGRDAMKLAGTLGIALGVRAFAGFITSSIRSGEAIGDLSDRLGISAEKFQALSYAAEMSGSSQDALVTAFTFMAKAIGTAERGGEAMVAEFKAIGISLDDIKGKAPDEVFLMIADAVSRIKDPIERTAAGVKFFGRSFGDVALFVSKGAASITALTEQAKKYGLVLSNEMIRKSQAAGDEMDTLNRLFSAGGIALATEFLPAFRALVGLMIDPEFQKGVGTVAELIGKLIGYIADNIDLVERFAGAMAGAWVGKIGGAWGMLGGAAVGALAPEIRRGLSGPGPLELSVPVTPPKKTEDVDFLDYTPPDPDAASKADELKKKYDDLTASLKLQLEQLYMTDREKAISAELSKLGADASDEHKAKIEELTATLYDQTEAYTLLRDSFGGFVSDFVNGLAQGKTAVEALTDALKSLANKLLNKALDGIIDAIFSSDVLGGIFGGGKAGGGSVAAGKAYRVGEQGPELFVPGAAGTIATAKNSMGGSPVIQIINNTGQPVSSSSQKGPDGSTLTRIVVGEVKTNMAQGGFNGVLSGRFGARSQLARTN